jgi:signal transduction histidine kinase
VPEPIRERLIEIFREGGMTSYMVIPLAARGRLLGLMCFISAHEDRPYGPDDLLLAEALASRAAVAVDNARLYDEAQRALHAREEFLLSASHKLRAPLASLSLAVQALLKEAHASKASDALLGPVQRSTQHLVALADELLDVSRLTAGVPLHEREDLDLRALVAEVTDELAELLQGAGCTVRPTAQGPTNGYWDRRWLIRILSNLLSNAAKYGKGRPIDVDLAGSEGTVRLTVRDYGIGIPTEEQARIFERSERALAGLWIVRRMVEALGGVIRVESRPNEGATFVVEFSRHTPAAESTRR